MEHYKIMKIKTDLLETFDKSFKKLKEIRKFIFANKMQKLSKEINDFYNKNEKQIKKWKRKFDKLTDEVSIWHSEIDSDIDPKSGDMFSYVSIYFQIQGDNLEVELYYSFFTPDPMNVEMEDGDTIYKCFFKKGLQKKDLDVVTSLLFTFVYLGGNLNNLEQIDEVKLN